VGSPDGAPQPRNLAGADAQDGGDEVPERLALGRFTQNVQAAPDGEVFDLA
jgi:hypothetical protein